MSSSESIGTADAADNADAAATVDTSAPADRTKINTRVGRVLIFIYGLFALSAASRGVVEMVTKFHRAPLAYVLSAIAGLLYIVATFCLVKATETTRRVAIGCFCVELVFVLAVGIATTADKSAFPDSTVWSGFGYEYGYVPLLLPIIGLWWLLRGARRSHPTQ